MAALNGTATVSGGAGTLSLNSLAQGSHSLTVAYSGDTNNASSSSSAVTVVVSPRTGMTWQYGYDAMGRINTVVDPNGLASYTYYDSLGRPIQTQQPPNTGSSAPTVIRLGYDLADSLTSVTDPRNLATTYSPNGLGNVNAQSSPDSGASQYTYDANGNMLTSVDARGKQTGADNLRQCENCGSRFVMLRTAHTVTCPIFAVHHHARSLARLLSPMQAGETAMRQSNS
jgi:YD repeat-containing protein